MPLQQRSCGPSWFLLLSEPNKIWKMWLYLRQMIPPRTVETGRQGSCFGSEEHLRTCGMVEDIPCAGKHGKPRTFASSYLGKPLSLSEAGLHVVTCFSTGEMQIQHSVQQSGCIYLRQGNWKGSVRDWFLDQLIKWMALVFICLTLLFCH